MPFPVVISVYTRINHFRQCVESLQKNILASESELYIYSDAASRNIDELLVKEVREYAHTITGFKKVHVIEREINKGGIDNILSGIKEVLENNKAIIFMEDDIITAPGFLMYMNEALRFYENDTKITSITGYCPPIDIPEDYNYDFFILPRYNAWGCGIFPRTLSLFFKYIDKSEFKYVANKNKFLVGGDDVLRMIEKEVAGEFNAPDVRCMFYQALHNKFTVYPRYSLVQNIGHDGSGIHCDRTNKFHIEELWGKNDGFTFINDTKIDSRILKANRIFRRFSIKGKVINCLIIMGLFPFVKRIKNILNKI